MLHKVTHNKSTLLPEEHLKCADERSRLTSGGDDIEKKTTPLESYFTFS